MVECQLSHTHIEIKDMGEKFASNPVMGTGSMRVPNATSLGHSGFGSQLSLDYNSGAGNGIFVLWTGICRYLSITRKTDKGLHRCWNSEESDVFILSGAEDLLPLLKTWISLANYKFGKITRP